MARFLIALLPVALGRIWAGPNTLLGIAVGTLGIATGGKGQLKRGCFEFYGGGLSWLLKKAPIGGGAMALTLGHTIIGQTAEALDAARDHEHVHVQQYQRWGPLFLPAYFLCSGWMILCRRDPYRENPFEVEAYSKTEIRVSDPEQ